LISKLSADILVTFFYKGNDFCEIIIQSSSVFRGLQINWKLPIAPASVGQTRQLNANRASISRTGRAVFTRTYPTTVVLQNGSTICIRYHEPRCLIKMPLDLSTMSEEDRQRHLERRRPKKKVKIVEDVEDSFDLASYTHLWKK